MMNLPKLILQVSTNQITYCCSQKNYNDSVTKYGIVPVADIGAGGRCVIHGQCNPRREKLSLCEVTGHI